MDQSTTSVLEEIWQPLRLVIDCQIGIVLNILKIFISLYI